MRMHAGRSRAGARALPLCGLALIASLALVGCSAKGGSPTAVDDGPQPATTAPASAPAVASPSAAASLSTVRIAPSTITSPSSAPVTTRPVAVATVTVTSAPTSRARPSAAPPATVTRTVSASSSPTAMSCPSAAALNAALHQGLVANTVRCFDDNTWLIVTGLLPSGQQADGVVLIEQTKPGSYTDHGAGSDWGTAEAGLRSQGVPDDVIAALPGIDGGPATTATSSTHPFSDYVGQWGRHEGSLTVKADHTGRLIEGAGCCDSVSVPLTFTVTADGKVRATASGKPTYTGSQMNDVSFDGTVIWLHFERIGTEDMLVTSNPDGSDEGYWCSPQQTGQCGA